MAEPVPTGDIEALSFEQAQAELETIVERLEDPHTGLDDAIALWERGERLHAYCQRKLDYAAERIEQLHVGPDEAAAVNAEDSASDFAPESDSSAAAAPDGEESTATGDQGETPDPAPEPEPVKTASRPAARSSEPHVGPPSMF